MDITVRGKHIEVPDELVARAERKLSKLDHYLPLLADALVEVDVAHEKTKEPEGRYVVHVRVSANGVHLRTEEKAAQPAAAIDAAAKVLTEQARRQKQRLYERSRTTKPKELTQQLAAPEPAPAPVPDDDDESEVLAKVAETRRVPVKPMTTEEAVEQIELLGAPYFIFLDVDVNQFALLYRREQGDYGLIIPEPS